MKVIFHTFAYNADNTIERTIKSVKAQTYENWVWYLLDNGSTDNTGEIIREHAKKDSRIISFANRKNLVWEEGNNWWEIVCKESDDDYFCWLDGDDEYKPDFLEKMLSFVEENNLDIAVGGNDFINAETNQLSNVRKLNNILLIEGESFGIHFPVYHQFIRTWWGKLFKISVIKKYNPSRCQIVSYGVDTLFTTENIRNAARVGIYPEAFYRYYVSTKSVSYRWNEKRIISDRILHDNAINFLMDKVGFVSIQNKEFLFAVYFHAIEDTLNVLLSAQISTKEKLAGLHDIFTSSQTRELSELVFFETEECKKLFKSVSNWIALKQEARSGDGAEKFAEIISVTRALPASFNGWSNAEIFELLAGVRAKSNSVVFNLELDTQIVSAASRQPLLNGLSAEFLMFFEDIAVHVLNKKFEDALGLIEAIIAEEQEVPVGLGISLVTLGLNLSAKIEKMDYFIFFKKMQISLLLDAGQKEKAAAELADWDEMMPDDGDFMELRRIIKQIE
jgi:glycosyltransferase involved in cell wall biosynthesis